MKLKRTLSVILSGMVIAAAFTGCGGGKSGAADNGGADKKSSFDTSSDISVVSREDGSGTRGAFIELFGIEEKGADGTKVDKTTSEAIIANKTDVMLTNISGEEYAIGYVSLGSLSDISCTQSERSDRNSDKRFNLGHDCNSRRCLRYRYGIKRA